MKRKTCKCKDFKIEMDQINRVIFLDQMHRSEMPYTYVSFNYCPWCGKKLEEE